MIKQELIISFDKTERHLCECVRPEKYDDLFKLKGKKIIAQGAGLSYCNAGANTEGFVVDMKRMNRILNLDLENCLITAEAGISIGELSNLLISKGFEIPVIPGYPAITLGGCVAFNVHGKSQSKTGNFGDWVTALNVFHPEHGEIECNNTNNTQLLMLTIGGLGLTGIITTVTLKIVNRINKQIHKQRVLVKNIYDSVKVLIENQHSFEHVYSWNNLNHYGSAFGKGFVYLEKYIDGNSYAGIYKNKLTLSYRLPAFQTEFSVRLMCNLYYRLELIKKKNSTLDLFSGSFPIYNKEIYYYLFGKKGFREYQILFPYDTWEKAISAIELSLKKHKVAVALGSLKLFSGKQHHMNFTGSGICLALDVLNDIKSQKLFTELDQICIQNHGVINLSKDSRVTAEFAKKVFADYDLFKKEINEFDSGNLVSSELKKRLNLIA